MSASTGNWNPVHREIPVHVCDWARREELLLASYAMFSKDSRGRRHHETLHPYRGPFQRDRDRVLHSSAFRRLSGKMQVFTGDMGDYHRTRLTHTQEVATIARTLGRVLRLNEDLMEALALLHDIGHPPYGHSGEDALNECLQGHGGFSHNRFAVVLVEQLETRYTSYPGLNLTYEVLAGQTFRVTHSHEPDSSEADQLPVPILEVQLVDLADSIAYNAHDVDDALTLGLLQSSQLESLDLVQRAIAWGQSNWQSPSAEAFRKRLVHSLIDVQVADVVETARQRLDGLQGLDQAAVRQLETTLELSPTLASEKEQLSQFLFDNVYRHPQLMNVRRRAAARVKQLFDRLQAKPELLPPRFHNHAQRVGLEPAVGHYLAGMTDRFCDARYRAIVELGDNQAVDW
ncbi:MAG: dNTP triphosphohydrolase [bacterium]|nr:dNTP triphosphohydrolase [bacterium]